MFEKEAEVRFQCKKVLYKWETDKRSYIDGFKEGAEFGYNKANEWHYPTKGEMMKQLTKAKEIIKYLCGMVRELNKPNVQLTDVDYSLSEAEQFLREVKENEN